MQLGIQTTQNDVTCSTLVQSGRLQSHSLQMFPSVARVTSDKDQYCGAGSKEPFNALIRYFPAPVAIIEHWHTTVIICPVPFPRPQRGIFWNTSEQDPPCTPAPQNYIDPHFFPRASAFMPMMPSSQVGRRRGTMIVMRAFECIIHAMTLSSEGCDES